MLLFFAILLFLTIGLPALLFAPWVPTRRRDFDRIAQLMQIQPGMVIMDLGCGTGGPIFDLARRFPQAQFIGVELSLPLHLICLIRSWTSGVKNMQFRFGNLLTTDISKADRIYLFGVPKTLSTRLKEKFRREAKEQTRIISYCFEFENWKPEISLPSEGML